MQNPGFDSAMQTPDGPVHAFRRAVPGLDLAMQTLDAPLPMFHARVDEQQWQLSAHALAGAGARLVSTWGAPPTEEFPGRVCAAYALPSGLLWLELAVGEARTYPDLAAAFPFADRMQRATTDLVGLSAAGSPDRRPWLDHGAWGPGDPPLRGTPAMQPFGDVHPAQPVSEAQPAQRFGEARDYPFVHVQGEGVHEIPVGPVHAGIIEPGHFRFSVVGEKVLRLEQRLGYTHKGIERRFTELAPLEAHRLAGRVCGDSTVAYTWAYCMALESAVNARIPPRAAWLRTVLLERERIANHLGDLGALGNDAGLAFGLAQFSRLRENWLRSSNAMFGHRLMMDTIVPGGVACNPDLASLGAMRPECDRIEAEVRELRKVYDEHAGLQDRFTGAGCVVPELARTLGLTGLAGRASGQSVDLRCAPSWPPYDTLRVRIAGYPGGDVAARVGVRFDEIAESLRILRSVCASAPEGAVHTPITLPKTAARGAGWVEGWRGEVLVALELGADATIRRCHCHDPSWQNWPVLQHAVMDNIVPDFPLINKSFNLTYSGHDL